MTSCTFWIATNSSNGIGIDRVSGYRCGSPCVAHVGSLYFCFAHADELWRLPALYWKTSGYFATRDEQAAA